MALDAEGYGYGSHEEGLERLLTDARVLSPAGIERAAWGWDRHEDPAAMQRFRDAEKAGLRMLEQTNRIQAWDDAKKRILIPPEPIIRGLQAARPAGEIARYLESLPPDREIIAYCT